MSRRRVGLADRVKALTAAVEESSGRLDEELLARSRALLARVGQRQRISGDATVVALAGATGSGKSSLFNALAGAELAVPGVRRPTTSEAMAVTFGEDSAEELLDWLSVRQRHALGQRGGAGLDDLVLLDLPDHDSTERAHRAEVDRLVELVDALVWVVDPQKYADAALHRDYLVPLARQAEQMIIVLNQVDRLEDRERKAMVDDLRRLLAREGLPGVEVFAVSATTGEGVDRLRERLARRVAEKRLVASRLSADVAEAARELLEQGGAAPAPKLGRGPVRELERQLAAAAGVPAVTEAVAGAWRHRGALATGWPALAWLGRFRPDPLKRLRLGLGVGRRRSKEIAPAEVSRSSLPATAGVERARVDSAIRALVGEATEGLARPWRDSVRAAARRSEDRLADDLDRAVATTDLGVDRVPVWWRILRVLQWLLVAAVLAGLGWLGIGFVLLYLQLPPLPPVTWWGFPAPTVLAVGGVLAGLVLAGLSRIGVEVGARRRRAAAGQALRRSVGAVARTDIVDPVNAELERYAIARDAAAQAAS
ncbi:GTPase [Naumannella huperziae]